MNDLEPVKLFLRGILQSLEASCSLEYYGVHSRYNLVDTIGVVS
jgi:hypothetical protein